MKAGHTRPWWTSESVFPSFPLHSCTKGVFLLMLAALQGQCHKILTAFFVLSDCKCIIGFLLSFFQHYCSPYFSLQWMHLSPDKLLHHFPRAASHLFPAHISKLSGALCIISLALICVSLPSPLNLMLSTYFINQLFYSPLHITSRDAPWNESNPLSL